MSHATPQAADPSTAPRTPRKVDPWSRAHRRWTNADGRSAEAQLARDIKAALVRHLGGNPSTVEQALIARITYLSVHLARMDAKALEGDGFSLHSSRMYLSWSNSLVRAFSALGLKPAAVEGGHADLAALLDGGA